jgi:hypothetical protein
MHVSSIQDYVDNMTKRTHTETHRNLVSCGSNALTYELIPVSDHRGEYGPQIFVTHRIQNTVNEYLIYSSSPW